MTRVNLYPVGIIIGVCLLLTWANLLPINNLLALPIQYASIQTEYRPISEAKREQLRSESPVIAENLIAGDVGRDYYERYISFSSVDVLEGTDHYWAARARFQYRVQAGNVTYSNEIVVWLDEELNVVRTEGIPDKDYQAPFKVTEEQALAIARYCVKPGRYFRESVWFGYAGRAHAYPMVDEYVWIVDFLKVSYGDFEHGGGAGGTGMQVFVDPYTGWVLGTSVSQWGAIP